MKNTKGQILVIFLAIVLLLSIMTPVIVEWVQMEAKWTVKEQKSIVAFNLAEAAIDRGIWKLKSSTSTWANARAGIVITNYNFDKTFDDIAGGYYRIKFAAGPGIKEVTIYGEGRDHATKETRAIECIVEDSTVLGALFSQGVVTFSDNFQVHWGPVVSHSNINISASGIATRQPRKFSKQVVQTIGGATPARDTNGLAPPNTNNVEWWSDYDVPEMPILDFATMRSSASAGGRLNRCTSTAGSNPKKCMVNNSSSFPGAQSNLIWYWDASITSSTPSGGCTTASPCTLVDFSGNVGLRGTLIVRGNMQLSGSDDFAAFTAAVPPDAWKEYQTCDTSLPNQYPADLGLSSSAATAVIGNLTYNAGACYGTGDVSAPHNTDVALRGFLYVGGNLSLVSTPDIHGAVWVVGTVTRTGSGFSLIFYDHTLVNIPTLNVTLKRKSWKEIAASSVAWAAP